MNLSRTLSRIAVVLLLAATAAHGAETLESLTKKAIAATGGLEKMKAVKSQRMKGKITFADGTTGSITVELKRPNRIRTEVSIPQGVLVQAFDGKVGWQQNPSGDTAQVSPAQARDMAESADLDGPLLGSKAKGYALALAGTEKVDGKDAFKVGIKTSDGSERFLFYDAATFLKVQLVSTLSSATEKRKFVTRYSDYRDVSGLKRYFHVKSGAEGSPQGQEITFESIEVNPQIDDARFAMPAAAPPAK